MRGRRRVSETTSRTRGWRVEARAATGAIIFGRSGAWRRSRRPGRLFLDAEAHGGGARRRRSGGGRGGAGGGVSGIVGGRSKCAGLLFWAARGGCGGWTASKGGCLVLCGRLTNTWSSRGLRKLTTMLVSLQEARFAGASCQTQPAATRGVLGTIFRLLAAHRAGAAAYSPGVLSTRGVSDC